MYSTFLLCYVPILYWLHLLFPLFMGCSFLFPFSQIISATCPSPPELIWGYSDHLLVHFPSRPIKYDPALSKRVKSGRELHTSDILNLLPYNVHLISADIFSQGLCNLTFWHFFSELLMIRKPICWKLGNIFTLGVHPKSPKLNAGLTLMAKTYF